MTKILYCIALWLPPLPIHHALASGSQPRGVGGGHSGRQGLSSQAGWPWAAALRVFSVHRGKRPHLKSSSLKCALVRKNSEAAVNKGSLVLLWAVSCFRIQQGLLPGSAFPGQQLLRELQMGTPAPSCPALESLQEAGTTATRAAGLASCPQVSPKASLSCALCHSPQGRTSALSLPQPRLALQESKHTGAGLQGTLRTPSLSVARSSQTTSTLQGSFAWLDVSFLFAQQR